MFVIKFYHKMKNSKLLIIAFIAIVLTSCHFTEEITLKRNGSGIYKLNVDMSAMIGAMDGMAQNDSIKKEPKKMDSVFYMKEIIKLHKDSISKLSKAEKASLEAIKDLKMRIQLNEETGKMLMDFIVDFKNLSELDDIKKKVEKAQQLQDNKGSDEKKIENHEVRYFYNKKKFIRKVIMKDLPMEDQERYEKELKKSDMFISGSIYRLVYHFPKKIKNVNFPNVQFSKNRKTMTIAVEMDSLTKNPQLLNLEVTF